MASDSFRLVLVNFMGIRQPDCFIKTLQLKFVVDCFANNTQYSYAIIWIENFLTTFHLLLNLADVVLCPLY
jgi:hypothetical protein